eukprot:scaffold1596_cov302-Pinguiococcus_pyrenoidosus.AAC.39
MPTKTNSPGSLLREVFVVARKLRFHSFGFPIGFLSTRRFQLFAFLLVLGISPPCHHHITAPQPFFKRSLPSNRVVPPRSTSFRPSAPRHAFCKPIPAAKTL